MCIIVYKPKGQKLDKQILETCYNNNEHGSGYMYVENGQIIIDKGLDPFKKIYKRYESTIKKTGKEENIIVVWHFRIKTHGKVDKENCHPFYINNGHNQAFCHNGVIRNLDLPDDSDESDTQVFRNKILNHLPKNWYNNPGIKLLVANFIQKTSKLLFLDKNENVKIINTDLGDWDKGIWYSNSSYKKRFYYNQGDNLMTAWNKTSSYMPAKIGSCSVCTFGYNKGSIWDYKVGRYTKPWEHSDPNVKRLACNNLYIMENFPSYRKNKVIYDNLTLSQLGDNSIETIDTYCYECSMILKSKEEEETGLCFYCSAIAWTMQNYIKGEIYEANNLH